MSPDGSMKNERRGVLVWNLNGYYIYLKCDISEHYWSEDSWTRDPEEAYLQDPKWTTGVFDASCDRQVIDIDELRIMKVMES